MSPNSQTWASPQRLQILVRLHGQGLTYSQISAAMQRLGHRINRNQIAGQVWRMKRQGLLGQREHEEIK